MVRRMIGVLVCGFGLSGCAVHELHKDHDRIRQTLLELYTDQIMDNLVRATDGMPIIQLDYTQAQGNVTVKGTVGGGDNQAATASNVLAIPAATLMSTRTIVTTLMGNLGAENTNQVSVSATPVTTSNEVYDAYLEFLSLPGSMVVTADPPPPGAAQMCKKCRGRYYWVPIQYRGQFFKLSLLTTAQRGKALLAPDEFFAVAIKEVVKNEDSNLFGAGVRVLTLKLDKKIPSDVGYLTLDGDKTGFQFDLHSIGGTTSSDTDLATINVKADKMAQFGTLPLAAKVFLHHRRPKLPTTDDLINRVNFNLQQIQFNQLRQPGL